MENKKDINMNNIIEYYTLVLEPKRLSSDRINEHTGEEKGYGIADGFGSGYISGEGTGVGRGSGCEIEIFLGDLQ